MKHYCINRTYEVKKIILFDYTSFKGVDFLPKNNVRYDGVRVNKIVIINHAMIKKILKKKIKRKLDLYLKLIIKFIDTENGEDGEALREALNDLTRYKSIVQYKYKKYLDEKYLKILLKKISVLEYEINSKLMYISEYILEDEKTSKRCR